MLNKYIKVLENYLDENRKQHCIRTMEMAKKLCDIYNIDDRAVTAALLHDIAKNLSLEKIKELVGDTDISDIDGMYNKNILHGYAGAIICKEKLNIDDELILSAVKYHTTGKKNMNDIEKVVYISDAIELGRKYEYVDKIRERVFKNLNSGILYEINHKLKYLIDRNIPIHKNTVEFRNTLIQELENE
ncbi:bis(5'-nucleosyl)-tetraphosphatase (symmetrical) YqeK [Caviibacter abscessus]|uniref:bis(5'-nucleosyl)-tetraphosphatase (symmetrical) YqeK n=1 Tax=Caviibacter abscessus TaxID=1766719 RepID=UPI0018D23073|nr:bis(5'-nucleosyl)-tetraphosphatase (symmetrical) YqeK [Caviibacter abscessus]